MIGRLTGVLAERKPPALLLDVQGVGYELEAPMSSFYKLPALGEKVTLLTHLVVREDAQLLYGFATATERELFRVLIKISGVGAKLALGILSGMAADELALCVQSADSKTLSRIPGIGKKTAERLIIELKDKVTHLESAQALGVSVQRQGSVLSSAADSPIEEAIAALQALGYKPADAIKMVKAVAEEADSAEALIKAALKRVVSL